MAHTCSRCNGSGRKDCERCGGTGTFIDRSGLFSKEIDCPHCYGSGKDECNVCDGSGKIDD